MCIAFEVIAVFGFLPPVLLSVDFAGLTALGLGTEALTRHVTVVGMKEAFTVRTFTLSSGVCHGPDSPQAYDLKFAGWKEENGDVTARGKRRKKTEEGD
jgi:hypothetical protein